MADGAKIPQIAFAMYGDSTSASDTYGMKLLKEQSIGHRIPDYYMYFGMATGNQDNPWTQHVVRGSCRSNREGWLRVSGRVMPFAKRKGVFVGPCFFSLKHFGLFCSDILVTETFRSFVSQFY